MEKSIYKRVAVVEYFFDIIYTVHVETEAKNGKHAGQKRTYRAVSIPFSDQLLFSKNSLCFLKLIFFW